MTVFLNYNFFQSQHISHFYVIFALLHKGKFRIKVHFASLLHILDIKQPYRPPRPVTGIALLYGDGVCFL
jgi:hypothetical protein